MALVVMGDRITDDDVKGAAVDEIPVVESAGDDGARDEDVALRQAGQISEQESAEEAQLYDIALRLARAGMLDQLNRPRKPRRPPPAPWRPRACQWIARIPTDDDNCKCGRPVAPGRSYCPAHLARVYLCRRRLLNGG